MIVKTFSVCKTIKILIIKDYIENIKNDMGFSIKFLFNNVNSLLYLIIINVYLALIIKFALCLIIPPNLNLYIAVF